MLDFPASFICSLRSFNFLSSSESLGLDSSFSKGMDLTPGSRGMDLGWNLSPLSGERGVSGTSGERGVSMTGEEGDSSCSLSIDLLASRPGW